jgi:hypothetical protein
VVVGEDARAYPKRILAWHEMVKDVVGGVSLNGVYCTLCGSMIVYRTEIDGRHFELGTSGFLYRSNKLMYDRDSNSLWSTLTGEPVVGSLVGQGLRLEPYPVVTTTWEAWRTRWPATRVLSLNTGHRRDYSEGRAYRDYFATDELMYGVPFRDSRLKNKDEVFIVRSPHPTTQPLAISLQFLRGHPLYHDEVGGARFVVLTDPTDANRAYAAEGVRFQSLDGDQLLDDSGEHWNVGEHELSRVSDARTLPRLAAHRAFWFGWHAAHPDTRLVSQQPPDGGSGDGDMRD